MITLRKFRQDDIPLLVEYLNNDKVTRYITAAINQPYTQDDALQWLAFCADNSLINAIEYDGQLVGCISATVGNFEYSHSAELGYWLGRQHWQKGIASQAVQMFIRQLQQTTSLSRVFVSVVAENHRSINVLTNNDFELEGRLKQASCKNGEFFDECIYAKLI
ncbi:MAG: GNAT family N-acetyltransferase [Psychrobium sp.]